MGAEEIKLNLDNSYINVIHFGSGSQAVVIISGVCLTVPEGQGEAIADAYRTLAEEYSIYLFERKKDLTVGYTIEDMTEDIYKAMNMLNISSAFVYGVSQGGMIAQMLALKHPEAVKKLVLCSTMCRPTETMKAVALNWLELAEKYDVVSLNRSFFKVVYSPAYLEKIKDFLPEAEKVGSAEDCDRFCILVKALLTFDTYDMLNRIECPVLVLGDKNDRTIGPEGSYEIIEKLGCENYIYDEYSHAVYDEAPDIQERIKVFLSSSD